MNEKETPKEPKDGLVLVGFGKHKLPDMLEWMGTEKEEDLANAFIKWPAVWRREEICSQEDIINACRYMAYIQDLLMELDRVAPITEETENGS